MSFIPMPSDFQVNKLIFLKESEYSEATKTSYWNSYLNFISDIEIKFNKDLYNFGKDEVKEYNNIIQSKSQKTINSANSFINRYIKWYSIYYEVDEKKFELFSKKEIDNSWYISKKDFFSMCEEMLKNTEIHNITPLVLARYSITGKQMIHARNLKWNDINFETNEVVSYNENDEITLHISVDYIFLKWMDMLKTSEIKESKDKDISNDYVLKLVRKDEIKIINYNTLNTRCYEAFKAINKPKISFSTLDMCSRVDYLHKLAKDRHILNRETIGEQLKEWYPKEEVTHSVVYNLRNMYLDWLQDNEDIKNAPTRTVTVRNLVISENQWVNKRR